MFKARIAAVLAVVVCCLACTAVALAYTTIHWAGNGYYLSSGQNGFTNYIAAMNESWGKGENRAVCAGIRGIGDTCVGRGYTAYFNTTGHVYVEAEAYLHNHDSEAGYFNGWYFGN
jgi:hypothetical protein